MTEKTDTNSQTEGRLKRLRRYLPRPRFLLQVIIAVVTFFTALWILVYLFYPVQKMVAAYEQSQFTKTPVPPSSTPIPPKTPTPAPTSTETPFPSPTAIPASAYQLLDPLELDPLAPTTGRAFIVLDEETSAIVNPPFSDIQWTKSSTIAGQIGRDIPEPYYATFGPGQVTWMVDVPLAEGYYEIYVLDTLYSSGGVLEFTTSLGDEILNPLVGQKRFEYRSSRTTPVQAFDLWRSIGIYSIDRQDILSVSTSWSARDELTIVAIDRVLIVHLLPSTTTLISQLPAGNRRFIADDSQASFETSQYWLTRDSENAWNGKFQILTNPPIDTSVTWTIQERVPVSTYELYIYAPEINGIAEVSYSFYVNGNLITDINDAAEISIQQNPDRTAGWQFISAWTIPDIYGTVVEVSIKMFLSGNQIGDIAADAVAIVGQ